MGMFRNVGKALSLLREIRGKSQANLAREAGIGKSQLSKYETGKELPKLESLEKVLVALEVGHFDFFYTLFLVDRRAAEVSRPPRGEQPEQSGEQEQPGEPPFATLVLHGRALLGVPTEEAFSRVFTEMLVLYRHVVERNVLPRIEAAVEPAEDLSAAG